MINLAGAWANPASQPAASNRINSLKLAEKNFADVVLSIFVTLRFPKPSQWIIICGESPCSVEKVTWFEPLVL